MVSVNSIRATFLDFFAANGHEIVASAPLVPHNDPTLLFTNAGMVPFKNVFTGLEHRPYNRATTAQKCVRAGGKHNDLDNVGYTARHHTFFEMLGNFSFGDYFKDRAIELAWNLVTKEFGLPADKLLITVYAEDDEAHGLWRKIAGLPEDKILRIPTSDNFWQMGDTGPCGPCSEIFYDHGADVPGGPPGSPDEDGDRFIEIWNLVFMQYEQHEGGRREALPKPSIDTGMGLERIAAVLQGQHDNYAIDLFRTIIAASEELLGVKAEGARAPSFKVVADHLRACSFLLADGVMPANDGRGYVLRRILRRGVRHGYLLGAKEPLLHRLVPVLVGEMGEAYPELRRAQALIGEILKLEEEKFRTTLERGLRLLDEATADLPADTPLPGATAFKLYDTYGFPLDLTADALRGTGRAVDMAGFDAAMAEQKRAARASWKGSGEQADDALWFDLFDRHGATEFYGYDRERLDAQLLAIVKDGRAVERAVDGDTVTLIVNQTPFYGESGGQIGDTGRVEGPNGSATITDTQKKLGALFAHQATVAGQLSLGDAVTLRIDVERRTALRRAHSATHLLHAALRRHLGDHVAQKGSLVAPDRLRFDFAQPKPVTPEQLSAIEAEVNTYARQNDACTIRVMAQDEAIKAGAMALFGEKYGDEVRVVAMGHDGDAVYSLELCGGTHIGATGEIGAVKLIGESGVAGGVRRIEALTGAAALKHVHEEEALLGAISDLLKVRPNEAPARIGTLLDERKKLNQEISALRQQLATGGGATSATPEAETVAGVKLAARVVRDVPAKDLRGLVDSIKQQQGGGVVALVGVSEDKAALVVGLGDALKDQLSAVDLVRAGVAALGGKGGGGRPDFAQGGGPNADQAEAALAAVRAALQQALAAHAAV